MNRFEKTIKEARGRVIASLLFALVFAFAAVIPNPVASTAFCAATYMLTLYAASETYVVLIPALRRLGISQCPPKTYNGLARFSIFGILVFGVLSGLTLFTLLSFAEGK